MKTYAAVVNGAVPPLEQLTGAPFAAWTLQDSVKKPVGSDVVVK